MEERVDFALFRRALEAMENSDLRIRIRMSGQEWMEFSKLLLLSENAMILQNGTDQKVIINLRNAVQFEIDQPLHGLAPYTPYEIHY